MENRKRRLEEKQQERKGSGSDESSDDEDEEQANNRNIQPKVVSRMDASNQFNRNQEGNKCVVTADSYICTLRMHVADWFFPRVKFMPRRVEVTKEEAIRTYVCFMLKVSPAQQEKVWGAVRPQLTDSLRKRRNAVTSAMRKVTTGKSLLLPPVSYYYIILV